MNVLLGMSGGIDSSVAAILLQQQGYHVIGVTLRLGSQTDGIESTTIPSYITEAQDLASQLGIEHIVLDVRKEFIYLFISYFKNEYLAVKTPTLVQSVM
jgi:tRNA-specific 2-thiouridylase